MKKRIVVALGGNALGNNPTEQKELVKVTAKAIVGLIKQGHEVIVGHGNGPQVGMISNSFEIASKIDSKQPFLDLPEAGAMSQGYIGFHLQQAIQNELALQKVDKEVVTLVTQVMVDKADPAFAKPSKPIGSFYDEKTARELATKNNWTIVEDAGRGWRHVVASPKPVRIVEKQAILKLVESNFLVIACGGGGIPVLMDGKALKGVDAVIDKDFATAKLAEELNADTLMILTAVDKVSIKYRKPDQKDFDKLNLKEIEKYIADGEFAPGSMLPKIQAAAGFVKSKQGRQSIIASLEKADKAIDGKSGTLITN